MINSIATPDQFAAEDEVRQMLAMPVLARARATVETHWRIAHGQTMPADQLHRFEAAMDEYLANYAFKAAACDPVYPRFVRNFMAPYTWNGIAVPGARMGGDNPDNCYRLTGIEHGGRYRVRAAPAGAEPAHVSFTLTGNWGTSVTIRTIEWHRLAREPDGSAIITIDAELVGERANHLITTPHTKFLFVRDSMMDWACETPLALEIERLDRPARAPLSLEENAERAAFRAVEEVPLYYWFHRLSSGKAANLIEQPIAPLSVGGLSGQASAIGRLRLEGEQAAILTFDPAGARYASAGLLGWWYHSIDAHERQSSLTAAMGAPNPDGSLTCVISGRDPGVSNWIDTAGWRDTLPLIRWQGLPTARVRRGPWIDLEIVALDMVEERLLAGVKRVDAVGRAAQLAARRAAYARRIAP